MIHQQNAGSFNRKSKKVHDDGQHFRRQLKPTENFGEAHLKQTSKPGRQIRVIGIPAEIDRECMTRGINIRAAFSELPRSALDKIHS